jgi:hypothetical protein
MAALSGALCRTFLAAFSWLSSAAMRLLVVPDVFPTTASAGSLIRQALPRILGYSAAASRCYHSLGCLCSARGNGYIGEDLEDLVKARHPLRGSCA